jgi:cell division protein FtsW
VARARGRRPLRSNLSGVKKGHLEAQLLLLVTFALVAFGLVMVYSATSASAAIGGHDPSYYLKRQGTYSLLGLGLLFGASRFGFRRLRRLAPALVLASLALCAAVLVVARPVNGAKRWLEFGPAVFQPSELAKLALALWAAAYLARRPAPRTLGELARPYGLLAGVFAALLMLQPDLGTTICIFVMLAATLVVAGTPLRLLATAGSITLGLGALLIWIEPYRRARVFSFLNPWDDAQGTGFQSVQALIGIGSGGVFGVGLGEGVQKVFYLPEAHTDMILAIIGEELGLVGTTAVIAAFATFAYAGFRIALACRDPFGKRLAAGLTALVAGQAAINLAAVLGLAPLTGIPLPFVSYGGSSLVVLLAGVGVLLNIAGDDGVERVAVSDRRRRNSGARPARARSGGSAARPGRPRDVRRVAGSRRSAARS